MPTIVFCCGATQFIKELPSQEKIDKWLDEECAERGLTGRKAEQHRKKRLWRGFMRHVVEGVKKADGTCPDCYSCPCRGWSGHQQQETYPEDFWQEKDGKYKGKSMMSLRRFLHTCYPLCIVSSVNDRDRNLRLEE